MPPETVPNPASGPCRSMCTSLRATRGRAIDALGARVGDTFSLAARMAGQLGLGGGAPGASLRNEADALAWHRVDVDGRTVVYGSGGHGPPVLFLHGWGLGSRAYRRALRRLTARGCRVLAPAMPGFGGSDAMPLPAMSIAGYAAWASAFLDAVGVDEPALVVGHSFGGGVAAALAHARPDRVRYLVLLNAVGGATWRAGSLADRPLWDWVRGFGRDFVGPEGLETLGAMSQDLLTNIMTNPLVLARAGQLAKDADLTAELATIDVPVLALTSDSDEVIPSAAFETLCASIGAEGRTVRGGHSWVLADPDHFAEVVQNVIDVEVRDHRTTAAGAVATEVRDLLVGTTIPARVAQGLVDTAPALWLLGEPAANLAADLAMCHPPLQPGEIRAVARPMAGPERFRLTIVAEDRPGLLARTAAALSLEGLEIRAASAASWATGLAMHALVVEAPVVMGPDTFDALGDRLRVAVGPTASAATIQPGFVPLGPATVEVGGDAGTNDPDARSTVTVTARDQPGLLWAICQWFADHGASIESVRATTTGPVVRDDFIVVGGVDGTALATHLSSTPSSRRRGRSRAAVAA